MKDDLISEFNRAAAAKYRMHCAEKRLARKRRTYITGICTIIALGLLILTAAMLSTISAPAVPPTTAAPEPIPTVTTVTAAPAPTATQAKYPLTSSQYDILAALAHTEARGDGMEGMTAALMVVRNRWDDGRFGDSIEKICTPGQFHGLMQTSYPI